MFFRDCLNRSNDFKVKLRVQQLDVRLSNIDGSSRLNNNSLSADSLPFLVSFSLFLVIFPHSVKELSSAGGKLKVLNSHVNALRNDSVSDLFVDDDADSPGVDIEHASSAAVVVLVWHA